MFHTEERNMQHFCSLTLYVIEKYDAYLYER